MVSKALTRRALLFGTAVAAIFAIFATLPKHIRAAARGSRLGRGNVGIPFWGSPGTAENYTKPNYGNRLPASYSYAGDPTPTLTVEWRLKSNTAHAGNDEGVAGINSVWLVTAVNGYTTINVGTVYQKLNNIWPAMLAERSGTLILPAVKVKDSLNINPSGQKPGTYLIIRGAVDANGYWNTQLCPTHLRSFLSYIELNCPKPINLTIDIRNLRIGPSDNEIATQPDPHGHKGETGGYGNGGYGINHFNVYGSIIVRNCWLHRTNAPGGLSSLQAQLDEWVKRLTATLDCWDCQFDCGSSINGGGSHHNIYTQALKRFMMIRCWSHSSPTIACKTQNDQCIVLNCILSCESIYGSVYPYGTNRCLNITDLNDVYCYQTVFYPRLESDNPYAAEVESRAATQSCFQGKRPALHYMAPVHVVPPGSTSVQMKSGGIVGVTPAGALVVPRPNHTVGSLIKNQIAGDTNIRFSNISEEWGTKEQLDLQDSVNKAFAYDVYVVMNDTTTFRTIGMITSHSLGNVTMKLSAGLPSSANGGNSALFVPNANSTVGALPIDLPVLNEPFCNPAHPSYPWINLNDGTGKAKLTDPNMVPTIFDTCAFRLMRESTTGSPRSWVEHDFECMLWSMRGGDAFIPPLPPLRSTIGAWRDPPNAGYFQLGLNGVWPAQGQSAATANGLLGSDWIFPNVSIYKDLMGYDADISVGLKFDSQVFVKNRNLAGNPAFKPNLVPSTDIQPDMRWLDSTGTIHKIIRNGGSAPMPESLQTTLSTNAAQNATSLSLTSTNGISNGMNIYIALSGGPWNKRGLSSYPVEWFFTTVVGSPNGSSVKLAKPLPYSAASGAEVTACTAAGSKPSWWPDVVTWGTS